jgi:hypothetical protein
LRGDRCKSFGPVYRRHVHAQERSCVTLFSWQRQFALLASFNTRVTRRAAVFVGRVVVTVSVTPFVVGRMKYIFEVSEPHVVEQLAANCNQILYTAYEAIFETSTDFDNGIGAHGFFLPTTAAINKKNDRLLKQIADVTTKRDLYRQMRNQITTALLNLTGNGLTWVSS